MIAEAITLIGLRAADPTIGINACLAQLAAQFGWSAADVPPLKQVRYETTSLVAVLGQVPQVPKGGKAADYFPAQLIGQDEDDTEDPHAKAVQLRDGVVQLVIRDVVLNSEADKGTEASHRRLRATKMFLERFLQSAEADRIRDGVYVWHAVGSIRIVPTWQPIENTLCSTVLKVRLKCRDTAAY